MSLLEGHGDVTMDRAGADRIPSADRFSRVLRERRQQRGPARSVSAPSSASTPRCASTSRASSSSPAVEDAGRAGAARRCGAGPSWLPVLAEIRDPARWTSHRARRWTSCRSRPSPAGRPDPSGTPLPPVSVGEVIGLLGGPAMPVSRSPATAVVVRRCPGAPTRWRCWSWPAHAGLDVDRRPRRPRPAARLGRRRRHRSRRRPRPLRARLRGRRVEVPPGPNLEARARRARYDVLPDGVLTGHTADDQAETVLAQPAAGRRRSTAWPACVHDGRSAAPLLGLRRHETRPRCATSCRLPTFAGPVQHGPALQAQPGPPRAAAPLADAGRARPGAGAGPPGRLLADDAALLDELAAALDPTDARPWPPPGPPWPAGLCGGGCGPAKARSAIRRRRPRSSGSWPSPGARRWPASWPAAAG